MTQTGLLRRNTNQPTKRPIQLSISSWCIPHKKYPTDFLLMHSRQNLKQTKILHEVKT